MKYVRLQIINEDHAELLKLVDHHGHLSHLLRRGIKLVIKDEKARREQERILTQKAKEVMENGDKDDPAITD